MNSQQHTARNLYILSAAVSVVICIAYALFYLYPPLADRWGDLGSNLLTVLAAVLCAASASNVLVRHGRSEAPFAIWLNFSIGLWLWALAEVVWAGLNLTLGEVPVPSLADGLWLLGYVFFGIGLLRQYRIVFGARRSLNGIFAGLFLLTLVLTLLIVVLVTPAPPLTVLRGIFSGQAPLGAYIDLYYPLGDLAIGLLALGLVWLFRGGALARPWLALFIFTISDGLYAWLVQTGAYAWSAQQANLASLLVDLIYVAAYLVLGLGLLSHFLLLRFGPRRP
jgi:hypothetical protein